MKTTVLTITLIIFANTLYAQWATNGVNISSTNTGNVGINVASPVTRLSVNSGASAATTRDLTNSITIGAGNANLSNKYLGQLGFVSYDVNFSTPKIVAYISAEAAETYANDDCTASVMRFFTGTAAGNSPGERMVIDHRGNVGIGTGSPLATDKLSVNGNIRAKEVKVEMANWPDFVFAKSYVLPTLQETENHIKQKGHLPGIPSAAEVEKNGIELGDMNKKLLQKIEELTLHLIEQNKTIQKMDKEMQVLKSKIP